MFIPFDEKELEVTETIPSTPLTTEFEEYTYPISERDAFFAAVKKKPIWIPTCHEIQWFLPTVNPENIARGRIYENGSFDPDTQAGGPDMFGINWQWVPIANGSMEEEGSQLFEDANEWKDVLVFPDIDSWNWSESAEKNKGYLKENKFVQVWLYTGWFERLISFMGFENAAMALLDDDQTEAIVELMDALSDTYNNIIDHYIKWFEHIDSFIIHDDWGSQQAPFFSAEIAKKLFVPAMKKVTDHLHELGLVAELHSCGCHGAYQIENIISAGWDAWMPQEVNDIDELWHNYGDKIMLCPPTAQNQKDMTEEELIAAADEYVERYCTTPGKPVYLSIKDKYSIEPSYRKELYIQSRKAYAKWNSAL